MFHDIANVAQANYCMHEIIVVAFYSRCRLARVEGEIAELVQDFRYECEHILVSAMDHIS